MDSQSFQKIPNISIKKVLIKLRGAGISTQHVFRDLEINAGSWHYTGSLESDPSLSRGAKIWNYAIDRLTDEELSDCMQDESMNNG